MNDPEPLQANRPDPRFVEHLEWELRRAVRREARFAGSTKSAWRRVVVPAAALLLALSLGASSVLAAQELRRSQAAELLAVQYRLRLELALLHENAAREERQRLEVAGTAGFVAEPALVEAQQRLDAATHAAALLALDTEEVSATGHEPNRSLSAPLVDGRDFVTLRLDLDQDALLRRAKHATQHAERLALLAESGLTSASELERARQLEAELHARTKSLETRRQVRARFLAGDLTPARAELEGLQAASRADLAQALRELDLASSAALRTNQLAERGFASTKESNSAKLALQTAEFEVRLARAELQAIDARLAETR